MIDVSKAKEKLKSKVINERGKPSQFLADTIVQMPQDAQLKLGNVESIKRNMRNRKQSKYPPIPKSLFDFEVNSDWKDIKFEDEQNNSKTFFLFDEKTEKERVVAFATEESLEHLSKSETWFMDGTFKTAPNPFTQLFIIRTKLQEADSVTCLYALLSSKKEEVYRLLLRNLVNTLSEKKMCLNVTRVMSDFEVAIRNAVIGELGQNVIRSGCYYHFTQCIWRKIQEEGLAEPYKNDKNINTACKMLKGIAYLPV